MLLRQWFGISRQIPELDGAITSNMIRTRSESGYTYTHVSTIYFGNSAIQEQSLLLRRKVPVIMINFMDRLIRSLFVPDLDFDQ